MDRPDLRDLLIRAVLDPEFRDAVRADPAGACGPFDLSETERAALCRGGEDILRLLGTVVESPPLDGEDVASAATTALAAPPAAEPTIRLLVRLTLSVDGEADAGAPAQLRYAAGLQMLPDGADPSKMPPLELSEDDLPGTRLDDILFELRIVPHVARDADGRFHLTCRHATLPVGAPGPLAAGADRGVVPEAIRALAEGVRQAPPDQRYDRLRDLLAALDAETADG